MIFCVMFQLGVWEVGGDDTYFILSVAFAVIIQHQTRADDLFLIYFNTLSTPK